MPGRYIAVGFYSRVAIKRSSTVDLLILNNYMKHSDTIFSGNLSTLTLACINYKIKPVYGTD